jgi:hypothetical protein
VIARIGTAVALIGALAGCGLEAPSVDQAVPAAVEYSRLNTTWDFVPATEATAQATGSVTIKPGVSAVGPTRTLNATNGAAVEAALLGETAPSTAIGASTAGELMGVVGPGAPTLYSVAAETPTREGRSLCSGAPATHILWFEPEMIEGRFVTIAVLSGAPGAPNAAVCQVLRYSRVSGN